MTIKVYKEIPYIVHVGPVGSYCAYIRVPEGHPWFKYAKKEKTYPSAAKDKTYTIHDGYNSIEGLDVHGGLTFSKYVKCHEMRLWRDIQGFTPGFWIGWDYAHYMDVVPGIPNLGGEYYYSEGSVTYDCENAIDQMLEVQ